ncbi:MAG: peptide deformylase [Rhodospirillales bacterium]|nr:peptide deformylase [Rhodospirillales bacterium]
MAILKIARMGHPVLFRTADALSDPTAPEVAQIADDMIATLEDSGGIGLAAPQVHISKRIVVFFIPGERTEEEEDNFDQGAEEDGEFEEKTVDLTVMINPVIEPLSDEMVTGWEACLSVPDMMGAVPRFAKIRYRWQTLEGGTMEREADGFHARAVQHECDHLDGVLYPMRMADMSSFGFAEEIHRYPRKITAPEEQDDNGENPD